MTLTTVSSIVIYDKSSRSLLHATSFCSQSTPEFSAIGHTVSAVFEDTKLDAPEAISDTVGSNNIGFKMLQKFGWKGNGLGKREQGDRFRYFETKFKN